jgi:MFS family permease
MVGSWSSGRSSVLGEGIFPAASMKAITERTQPKQPKHRPTANGLMLYWNALGSVVAPLVAGPALAYFGWRDSFFWSPYSALLWPSFFGAISRTHVRVPLSRPTRRIPGRSTV